MPEQKQKCALNPARVLYNAVLEQLCGKSALLHLPTPADAFATGFQSGGVVLVWLWLSERRKAEERRRARWERSHRTDMDRRICPPLQLRLQLQLQLLPTEPQPPLIPASVGYDMNRKRRPAVISAARFTSASIEPSVRNSGWTSCSKK